MKLILFLTLLGATHIVFAQQDKPNHWEISTSFSVGSENNIGNPGFMLTSEGEYFFHKALSVSSKIGFFHSVTTKEKFDANSTTTFLSNFSALTAGLYLNHTNRFGKNYVQVSAGGAYFHSNTFYQDGSSTQVNTTVQVVGKIGYGLALEGGRSVSEKVGLGLTIQVYSYQIFGDIITIGLNSHFRL